MNQSAMSIDREILAARPPKNPVDGLHAYDAFVEDEHQPDGRVEPVGTILLTNRECPFRCVMCDLWKNTTDTRIPEGAIPEQIERALREMGDASAVPHIKLYNSGNFFDPQAIPPADHPAIAAMLADRRTIIVENHPRLCGDAVLRFRDRLASGRQLEIAMGLETIHPEVLPRLNKQMTVDDFSRASERLRREEIALRAFVLLRPPWLTEEEGVEWAIRSLAFAFDCGVRVAAIIPTRAGNGFMERLQAAGEFTPPSLESLETTLVAGLQMRRGRVFADLWNAGDPNRLPPEQAARVRRIHEMNRTQQIVLANGD